MRYYPLFLDLTDARCLVAGAGAVGQRKIRTLLQYPVADILVLDRQNLLHQPAPDVSNIFRHPAVRFEQRNLAAGSEADALPSGLKEEDLLDRTMVFATTSSSELNAALAAACRKRGLLCNTASAPSSLNEPGQSGCGPVGSPPPAATARGNFLVPTVIRRDSLTLALSTDGSSPALARALRGDLEKWLGHRYDRLVCLLKALRSPVLALNMGSEADATLFRRIVERRDALADALNAGNVPRCRELLADILPAGLVFSFAEWLHELD